MNEKFIAKENFIIDDFPVVYNIKKGDVFIFQCWNIGLMRFKNITQNKNMTFRSKEVKKYLKQI